VAAVKTADTYFKRLVGLMFKKPDYALALVPCRHVHTFFCRVPLDLYYINKDGVVIYKAAGVKPWRLAPYIRGSYMVLEVPSPNSLKIEVGDRIYDSAEEKWLLGF